MTPSPSDAVEITEEAGEEAAEQATEAVAEETTDAATGGGSKSVTGALMHTEPDLEASTEREKLDVGPAGAHGYIGARKVLDYAVDMGESAASGMPALANFAMAGFHAFLGGGEEAVQQGTDEQENEEEALVVESEMNDPAVGGEP